MAVLSSIASSENNEESTESTTRSGSLGLRAGEDRKVVTDESIEIDGKKYKIKVFEDGELIINGKCWYLYGPGVTIKVEKFHYNKETEELEIKAEGSIPFLYPKKVARSFSKKDVVQILPHLISSRESKQVISIKRGPFEYNITLEPGSRHS